MKKVKHNIMSEGVLSPEDLMPDVTLWTLDGGQVKLKKTGIQVTSKLRYESSTLILYKELSSTIFQSCQ